MTSICSGYVYQESTYKAYIQGSGFLTFSMMATDMSDTRWPGPVNWAPIAISRLGPVLPSVPVMLTQCWYILNSETHRFPTDQRVILSVILRRLSGLTMTLPLLIDQTHVVRSIFLNLMNLPRAQIPKICSIYMCTLRNYAHSI